MRCLVGVVCLLITGAPTEFITEAPRNDNKLKYNNTLRRLFKEWNSEGVLTDGSAIAVLWNPNYWNAHYFIRGDITKHSVERSGLCFKLRRVPARNNAYEDHIHVIQDQPRSYSGSSDNDIEKKLSSKTSTQETLRCSSSIDLITSQDEWEETNDSSSNQILSNIISNCFACCLTVWTVVFD